jgi:hypothetical protein
LTDWRTPTLANLLLLILLSCCYFPETETKIGAAA